MKFIYAFVLLGIAAALAGCAGPRPQMSAPYTIEISVDPSINLDRQNRATPVQVRLFELRNSARFESIDFFSLYEKDDQALAGDVLAKEQLILQPGQRIILDRKANMDARMLGVYVAFRDIERSSWRAVAPLPQSKEVGRFALWSPSFDPTTVNIRVSQNSVSAVTVGKGVPAPIPGSGGLPQTSAPPAPGAPSGYTGTDPYSSLIPGTSRPPSMPTAPSMPTVPSLPRVPSVPAPLSAPPIYRY